MYIFGKIDSKYVKIDFRVYDEYERLRYLKLIDIKRIVFFDK